MNKSLRSINNDFVILEGLLIESEGELTPEIAERLEINDENFNEKIPNTVNWIKHQEDLLDNIKKESKRLSELKKSVEKNIKSHSENIKNAMLLRDLNRYEAGTNILSFRKSVGLDIEEGFNVESLDEEYQNSKTTITPDKKAIKEALKKGDVVEGCSLSERMNLQIK